MKTLIRSAALSAVALVAAACNNGTNVDVPIAPVAPSGRFVSTLILSPNNEVPPVTVPSTATGTAIVTLDTATRSLSVSGSFNGLTSPATVIGPSVMHIHEAEPTSGQTFAQATGDVFEGINVNLAPDQLSGVFNSTIALADAEEVAEFLEGRYYLNLHTELNPAGELRAQMNFDNTPSSARVSTISLSPDKEVPPVTVPSSATGSATVILDTASGRISVGGSFSNLSSPGFVIGPSMMHIHEAQPEAGQAFTEATGPVFEGLTVVTDANNPLAGQFFGSFDAQADVAEFLEGRYYLNLHTELNQPGELRGQLEF